MAKRDKKITNEDRLLVVRDAIEQVGHLAERLKYFGVDGPHYSASYLWLSLNKQEQQLTEAK